MKTILEEICIVGRGDLDNIKLSEKQIKVTHEFLELQQAFMKKLDKKLRSEYDELENKQSEVIAENCLNHYKEGFKLGMRLAIEAFDD